jgi:hypothetical protein
MTMSMLTLLIEDFQTALQSKWEACQSSKLQWGYVGCAENKEAPAILSTIIHNNMID